MWEPATQYKTCSALLQLLYCQLPIPPSYFPFHGALERHGHTTLESGSGLDLDKTLACRTFGTPPRHAWRTVPPTVTTTSPAGAARTPAQSPQDQGRLSRPAPFPTVYFPQCSTTAPPRFGEKTTTSTIPCACTPPLLVSIKGGGGLYLRGGRSIHPVEHNTRHYSQNTYALQSPDIGTCLNQLL